MSISFRTNENGDIEFLRQEIITSDESIIIPEVGHILNTGRLDPDVRAKARELCGSLEQKGIMQRLDDHVDVWVLTDAGVTLKTYLCIARTQKAGLDAY